MPQHATFRAADPTAHAARVATWTREVRAPAPPADPAFRSAAATVLFSIVVPLHNKGRYIGCTLASVLAQTLPDFEVIVVDDGSTDGGADVVAAIDDPRVRLVRQANAGVSVARNLGIALARGEWIAFLDADDWQHPRYLASLVRAHRAHPAAGAVATRYLPFQDGDTVVPPGWIVPSEPAVELVTDLPTRWMQGPTLFTSSIAVRRSVLQRMQPCFVPGESFGEDLDLWFRVAEQTPIALLDAPLVGYRVGVSGSLTQRQGARGLPPWVDRLRQRALGGTMEAPRVRSTLRYIAQLHIDMARRAVSTDRRAEALRWLLGAWRAADSGRWWLTACMVAFWPGALVDSYVERRLQSIGQAPLPRQPKLAVRAGARPSERLAAPGFELDSMPAHPGA
ncbi:MAG: glycosyltransferase family 2 protein [Ramlibacter sp.]